MIWISILLWKANQPIKNIIKQSNGYVWIITEQKDIYKMETLHNLQTINDNKNINHCMIMGIIVAILFNNSLYDNEYNC